MSFAKSGLPTVRRLEEAYNFARKQPARQAWNDWRRRLESPADIAVDLTKILTDAIQSPDYDLIAGHLAGFALPLNYDVYDNPIRSSVMDLTSRGLHGQAAVFARKVEDFRFDNPDFPALGVMVTASSDLVVRYACLAGAIFHLDGMMKRYGHAQGGATDRARAPDGHPAHPGFLDRPVHEILQEELDRCRFGKNISFLGTTRARGLENRYDHALTEVERHIALLKKFRLEVKAPAEKAPEKKEAGKKAPEKTEAPAPAEPASIRAAWQGIRRQDPPPPPTPQEEYDLLGLELRAMYYKGPFDGYMAALNRRRVLSGSLKR